MTTMLRHALTLTLLASWSAAQSPTAALATLVDDPRLAGGRVGAIVLDLDDGDAVLARHDEDKGFMTASNMKLISSSTALLTLGADYRFETVVRACGPIEDGVLHGDLELVGSGDPTLGARQEDDPFAPFVLVAKTLAGEHRLHAITGAVLGIDDCQPDEVMGEGWSWGYQGESYAAQPSGLCFAENCITVVVTAAAAGPPRIALRPDIDYVTVVDRALCCEKPTVPLTVQRLRAANRVVVGGQIALDAEPAHEAVSVENPTAYAARALAATLELEGITVAGGAADADDVDRPERDTEPTQDLVTLRSPPLAEILHTLNKISQNLYAEQLIRTAARVATGDGSMPAAERHAKDVLAGLGVDTEGMAIADGSGLTRLDLVQPRQLATLLTAMWRGPHRDRFVATLPIAGIDGTLRHRFESAPARGHVHAKTGFISRVVALSGYVDRPEESRAPLVFSVLLNNFTCPTDDAKDAVDTFVNALAAYAGWPATEAGAR